MPPERQPERHVPTPADLRRVGGLGTAASTLILLTAIGGIVIALISWRARDVIYGYADPTSDVTDADLASVDGLGQLSGWLYLGFILGAGVVFITWLWRARLNSEELSYGQHYRERGWVVGSWFCPIVNLWFPYQVVRDVLRFSDPKNRGLDGDSSRGGPLVIVWWLTWLGSSIAAYYSFAVYREVPASAEDVLSMFDRMAVADTVSAVFEVAAAVLAIVIIRRITAWQESPAESTASPAEAPQTQ